MSRKLKRAFARGMARKLAEPHKGPCFAKKCKQNGGTIHHCITCEELVRAGKLAAEDAFKVQCCAVHVHEGLKKVRRHAVTAHPANLLRVVAAGLRGEEI